MAGNAEEEETVTIVPVISKRFVFLKNGRQELQCCERTSGSQLTPAIIVICEILTLRDGNNYFHDQS